MNTETLYDTDFELWLEKHISFLQNARFNEIDITHLIEELKQMSKTNQRELRNRLKILIAHLLKWEYQSAMQSNSWKSTIKNQRDELNDLLNDNPSLKNKITDTINEIYSKAVEYASSETGLDKNQFPSHCLYSTQQLLDENFYPTKSNS